MSDKGMMNMRGFPMPSEHKEQKMKNLDCCDMRYVEGEFSNPKDLEKSVEDLSNYAKKHKMKY